MNPEKLKIIKNKLASNLPQQGYMILPCLQEP